MDEWKDDIEKYRRGELTSTEMHALEKKALQDPFLADALKGASTISIEEFGSDVSELNERIHAKADKQVVAMFAQKSTAPIATSPNKPTNQWFWPLRIAASLLLIFGAFWFAYKLIPVAPNENMSLKKEEPKQTPALAKPQELKKEDSQTKQEPISSTDSKISGGLSEKKAVVPASENENRDAESEAEFKEEKVELLDDAKSKEEVVVAQEAELALLNQAASRQKANLDAKKSEAIAAAPSMSRKAAIPVSNFVRGKVLSEEDATPIPGVNVILSGTTIGTVTDENGNYQLPIEGPDQKLAFSFIGFQSKIIAIKKQQNMDVKLGPDASQLSEVVVVGYSPKHDPDHVPVVRLAEPAGGRKAYDKYLNNNVRYTSEALDKKIKGKVQVRFTVKTDGQLDDFKVVKSLGSGCDEEVVRLVKDGPAWSPTTEDNLAIESEVLVKVKFDASKGRK